MLAPALAALPWAAAGLTPLVLLLTYSGAVLAPLIALHLVSIVPFRLIEAFVELVTGGDPARCRAAHGASAGRRRATPDAQIDLVSDAAGGCCPGVHPWKCFAHHVAHAPSGARLARRAASSRW